MSTFRIDPRLGQELIAKWFKRQEVWKKDAMKKVDACVNIAFQIATSARPKIPKKKGDGKNYRVSDPAAAYGVPIKTGTLKSSIKKTPAHELKKKIVGDIWSDPKVAPYNVYVEYGTTRMAARPFMRPTIAMVKDRMKRIFAKPIP